MATTTKSTKTATKARRAVVYLRVSTDEQASSGLGLEAQLAACNAWCAARGYDVAGVYRDAGVSGSTPVDKRPGLTAALASLKRGWLLVVADRDRLARLVAIAASLDETARRMGAAIETPGAPASDAPADGLQRHIHDAIAQYNREVIAARTKAALAAKRARGEKTGGAVPLGHALAEDGKTLVADAAEREALELVRGLRADGVSMREIAARLNAEGVPCRGSRWHLTTVARLLSREAA